MFIFMLECPSLPAQSLDVPSFQGGHFSWQEPVGMGISQPYAKPLMNYMRRIERLEPILGK